MNGLDNGNKKSNSKESTSRMHGKFASKDKNRKGKRKGDDISLFILVPIKVSLDNIINDCSLQS